MIKTRIHYGEQVLNNIYAVRSRDEKVDIREIYLVIDQIVNRLAKEGFLENWKMGYNGVDELFLTRFEWISITDPDDDGNSYFTSPAIWSALPKLQGVNNIYFQNDFNAVTKKYFDTIFIITQQDFQKYRRNPSGNLQGFLSVYPSGSTFIFNQPNVGTTYGNIGIALVIKSSFDIADSAPFPIPANVEEQVIQEATDIFLKRRFTPVDKVRDNNDMP